MDDFEKELKISFLEEMDQLLADAEQCFLDLEANPNDMAILEKIFRIAHNVKGSSKAVGFNELGAYTHEFESFMLKCKSREISILPPTVSLLLKCNDHLKKWVYALKADLSAQVDNLSIINEILAFKQEGASSDDAPVKQTMVENMEDAITAPASAEGNFSPDEVSLSVSPNVPPQVSPNVPPQVSPSVPQDTPPSQGSKTTGDESIRVSLSRLDGLLNFVGEMVILQTVLMEQAYASNPQILRRTIHQMGKVTKEIQDISMSLRMVPLKQTFQKMQRIVRDTSALLGKKVQLLLEGEETEVDKTVLESLSDPLVHLIRNAVDHGVESPADRVAKGKVETGRIILRAYHQSGKLIIEVKDDGGGISVARLKQRAIEKGIIKEGQTISDKDAVNLIFHSGFSTKYQVTEVSGRGVGMDVVKTNIEQIQGEISVETVLNEGSTFKIILPLTLAIIDGMVIRCGQERYVIPLTHVHETMRPQSKDLKFITGMGEALLLRGETLPVVRISQALGKSRSLKTLSMEKTSSTEKFSSAEQIAIVVRTEGQPFAVLVDDVIGQHQVVIKKLGMEMQNLRGYSGSAILGDGKPAVILELGELVSSAQSSSNFTKRQVAI